MAEKIKIVELEIDDKALIKSTSDVKKAIDELKKEQKELTKMGLESSKAYVQNAADLKVLGSAYNANIKALADRTQATVDATNREQLMNAVLEQEVTTIAEAREQNKLLNKLRNETNATTAEGVAEIERLNNALDANNEFIKENADSYLKQKINIGNYKESIKEAFNEINIFNGGLGGFITRSKEAGGVGNLVTNSLKGMTQGFIGMTRAALSFIATPIGAVLAAVVAAFALVKNAMDRSEESTNKLKQAFAPFIGIVKGLLKALEPVGEFLIDNLVKAFELVEVALFAALDAIAKGLDFLGFDETAKSLQGFNDKIKDSARVSKELAAAEAELEKVQRQSRKTQLDYQKDAEKLRQIRDNENLSIKERIAANDELGKVLEKQLEEELKIAQQALIVANLRVQSEGQTKEALDAQALALTEISDIQERIASQESEQLTNRVALQKEAADKAREAAESRAGKAEQELELLREQRRFEEESLDELRLFADEEIKILNQKLKDKLISELEYQTEKLKIENDLKEAQLEQEEEELERIKVFEERKKELLNEIALANEEDAQAKAELKAEQDFEKQVAELETLQLNEQQKTELLALLETERQQVLNDIRANFQNQAFEQYKEVSKKELDFRMASGQESINIAKSVANSLIGVLGDSLGAQLAGIAVQAAIEAGLISINTASAQAANSAKALALGFPQNIPALVAAGTQNVALGAQSAAAISRVISSAALQGFGTIAGNIKFEKGGIVGIDGARHSGGGVPIYAGNQYVGEAEGGEGIGILNRAAYSDFMNFNNAHNSGYSGGGKFAGGGIITQAVRPTSNDVVSGLAEAMENIKIFTAVEDINTGQRKYAQVVNGANV